MKKYLLIILILWWKSGNSQSYEVNFNYPDNQDSSIVSELYSNCANRVQIAIFNINKNSQERKFKLQAEQGETKIKKDYEILAPADKKEMKISVLLKKKIIATKIFPAKMVPLPQIDFIVPGKKTVLSNGFIVNMNDIISFHFNIDKNFLRICPDDTLYQAAVITVVRNGNIRNTKNINGDISLKDFGLNHSETIKLELNKFKRINYNGEIFMFDASPEEFLILKIE